MMQISAGLSYKQHHLVPVDPFTEMPAFLSDPVCGFVSLPRRFYVLPSSPLRMAEECNEQMHSMIHFHEQPEWNRELHQLPRLLAQFTMEPPYARPSSLGAQLM